MDISATTAVETSPGRTNPQTSFRIARGTMCTSARGDHHFGVQWARPERLLARPPPPLAVLMLVSLSIVFLSSSRSS